MPKIPESLTSKLQDRVLPTLTKVKKVNPVIAKESATKGVAGAKDVVKLSIDYLKQETKGPLQGVGRLLGFGIAGAVFLGFGLILSALALLRGLQSALSSESVKVTENGRAVVDRGHFSGSLSWFPYFISGIGCIIAIAVIAVLIKRSMRPQGSATK